MFSFTCSLSRYTVSTKLICADNNKCRNKGSFNIGEETKPLLCSYDFFKARAMKLQAFSNWQQFSQIICQNILFAIGYYISSGIATGDLTNAKT